MLLSVSPFRDASWTGEEPFEATVRFRTVGDATCTGCVESAAFTVEEVVMEVAASRLTDAGRLGPMIESRRPAWRIARRRGTSDVWSCCAWPPPAASTTANRP